jgi:hypothetical protein
MHGIDAAGSCSAIVAAGALLGTVGAVAVVDPSLQLGGDGRGMNEGGNVGREDEQTFGEAHFFSESWSLPCFGGNAG